MQTIRINALEAQKLQTRIIHAGLAVVSQKDAIAKLSAVAGNDPELNQLVDRLLQLDCVADELAAVTSTARAA